MARIKTYIQDNVISDYDLVIGSDADNNDETKNFSVGSLREYMISGLEPESGGNLKITTITATDEVNLTPEDYFNNLEDPLLVLKYEIIFLILNGRTYIFRKNDDTYGVGGTEVFASDFTEIDITSVITSTLESQDLNSVLVNGNESLIDAKIGSIYLYDDNNEDGYVRISGYEDRINFYSKDNVNYGYISQNSISISNEFDQYVLNINKPNITDSDKNATFQNASGTIAYLSDIPEIPEAPIQDIEGDSEYITVTNVSGVYTISSPRTYVVNTQLRDSLTNTTIFEGGGLFEYSEAKGLVVNSSKLIFNENISSALTAGSYGTVIFLYENGSSNYFPIEFTNAVVSGSEFTFDLPLSGYWSDTVGERLTQMELTLKPDVLKMVGGPLFDGAISATLYKYFYKWDS